MQAAGAWLAQWRSRRARLLATFFLTVIFDLTVAVEVGLILASLFFIYRISQVTRIEPVPLAPGEAPADVEAYRLFGSLFFGAVSKLEAISNPVRYAGEHAPRVIVFDLAMLISLDTTGVDALRLHRAGRSREHCDRYASCAGARERSGTRRLR